MKKTLSNITKFSKIILLFSALLLLFQIISVIFIESDVVIGHTAFRLFENIMMIVVIFVPTILYKLCHVKMPESMEIALVGFSFSALILGDVFDFYGRFPWWDIVLHAISGIMLGILGLIILNTFIDINHSNIQLSHLFVSLWIVCFALSLGSIWEIWEYVTDGIFGLNSQEFLVSSGTFDNATSLQGRLALKDTMEDLILDFVGASTLAVVVLIKGKMKKNGN